MTRIAEFTILGVLNQFSIVIEDTLGARCHMYSPQGLRRLGGRDSLAGCFCSHSAPTWSDARLLHRLGAACLAQRLEPTASWKPSVLRLQIARKRGAGHAKFALLTTINAR